MIVYGFGAFVMTAKNKMEGRVMPLKDKKRTEVRVGRENAPQKRTKESILSRISRYTDVSLCAFSDFKIDIERTGRVEEKSVTAFGVCGIHTMTCTCVSLDYQSEYFVMRGEGLVCHAYADGAINVCGKITEMAFCDKGAFHDENI